MERRRRGGSGKWKGGGGGKGEGEGEGGGKGEEGEVERMERAVCQALFRSKKSGNQEFFLSKIRRLSGIF